MTFAGFDRLMGGQNTDRFRTPANGNGSVAELHGGGSRNVLEVRADADILVAGYFIIDTPQRQRYLLPNISIFDITTGASDNHIDLGGRFEGQLTLRTELATTPSSRPTATSAIRPASKFTPAMVMM